MPMRSGRLEKRPQLGVPGGISDHKEPLAAERATTENICSLGMRVLVRHAKKLNERLVIKPAKGELQASARVVYCERLGDGRYALGLEFEGEGSSWMKESLAGDD